MRFHEHPDPAYQLELANMQQEFMNLFKTFIYDAQNKNIQEANVNNPAIIRHKGRPQQRLKSSVETQGKRVLKDSTQVRMIKTLWKTKQTVKVEDVEGVSNMVIM